MSRFYYRCACCRTRHTFKQRLDLYMRAPKCRSCGSKNFHKETWMAKRNTSIKGQGCGCQGYWFTHRRGSKWCLYETSGEVREILEEER